MILGWPQTQPSGRVWTHLHGVSRGAAARRRLQATTRSIYYEATAKLLRGYYEATTRSTTRLLRGYYEATTRLLTTRLLRGYYEATIPGYYEATTRLLPGY
jgi:hypothetical protein